MKVRVTRTTVYLAGKINKNDWRGSLPYIDWRGNRQNGNDRWGDGSDEEYNDSNGELPKTWVPREAGSNLLVTGPFFESCDHGCGHGPGTHGVNAGSDVVRSGRCVGLNYPNPRRRVWDLCCQAIVAADVFFFWMDDPTAHGSLVELGMARALGKKIIICREWTDGVEHGIYPDDCPASGHCGCKKQTIEKRDELWFAAQCADEIWESVGGPFDDPIWDARRALARLDAHFAPPVPEPAFSSEIERKFWKAMDGRPLATGMVAQFEYQRVGGRTFRPDFAIPQHKIAIELDGFKHHATPEAFAADLDRQREMERDGWRFVRFTGKEINADVMKCVSDAEQFILMIVGGA